MKEWNAKTVFHSYLAEISETCNGIFLAKEARSTLYTYLNRETLKYDAAAEALVNTTLSSLSKIQDGHVVRSLFMSAHAGFEQYLRSLFEGAAQSISNAKLNRSTLSNDGMDRLKIIEALSGWQICLAGDAFNRYFEPLAHLSIDYPQVGKAIMQSGDGKDCFLFEGKVFGFRVGSIDQPAIEKLFSRFGHVLRWDDLASNPTSQKIFGSKSKNETAREITKYMADTLKTRNRIAHSQGEVGMGKDELIKQINFLNILSEYLFNSLSNHVNELLKK